MGTPSVSNPKIFLYSPEDQKFSYEIAIRTEAKTQAPGGGGGGEAESSQTSLPQPLRLLGPSSNASHPSAQTCLKWRRRPVGPAFVVLFSTVPLVPRKTYHQKCHQLYLSISQPPSLLLPSANQALRSPLTQWACFPVADARDHLPNTHSRRSLLSRGSQASTQA